MGTADIISRILQERGLTMSRSAHPEADPEITQHSATLRPPRPSRSSSSSPSKASLAALGAQQLDTDPDTAPREREQVGTQVVDDAEAAASRWILDSPRSRGRMPSSVHEPWTEEEVASRFSVAGGSLVAGRRVLLFCFFPFSL